MMEAAASGEVGGGVGVGLETQAERVRIAERVAAARASCQMRGRWSCGWCGGTRALVLG